MNSFRKIHDTWAIQCDVEHKPGESVTVTTRDGRAKQVKLGAKLPSNYGLVYAVDSAPAPMAAVGDLSSVFALFDRAKKHLKFPAIVLSVPDAGMSLRLNVAGERASIPGSVTVLDAERTEIGRTWLGRILRDGTYQPSRDANGRTDAVVSRLRAFAAEPAKIAADHGKLTGSCCFCNRSLTDKRSTAVGYGATCASHYGLPW
jgi:uncharacterized protein Veg